jgi:hypothetical protein
MKLPEALTGVPRVVFILALPAVAFIVAIGFAIGTSSNDDKPAAVPTLGVSVQAQAIPTPAPTPTTAPAINRMDCAAIRGSDYRSPDERTWFQANCSGTTASAGTTGAGIPSGGAGGTGTAVGTGGGAVGVEYTIGDQLVIPSIGVNAVVTGMDVGPNGVMPDPSGYFNAVWYNFAAIPGLGGYVTGGNLVMAGHVDCARCHGGLSGAAVFYNTRGLQNGATIQYYSGGQVSNYVVFQVADYPDNADWASIVAAGTADLTLITCNGVFDQAAHAYNLRNVVFAHKIQG